MFSDLLVSQVRTYVPAGVGAFISWLALRGVELNGDTQLLLVTGSTAAATGLYYSGARLIEKKWPTAGRFLLGSKNAPQYPNTSTTGGGAGIAPALYNGDPSQ